MSSFLLSFFIRVYSIAAHLGGFFALLVERAARKASRRWHISSRVKIALTPKEHPEHNPPVSSIWIHAASLGEAKVALRFIRLHSRKYPDSRYIVTATTDAGYTFMSKELEFDSEIVSVRIFPLDTISRISYILSSYRVIRVWLVELELWPCLLWTCARFGVPVGVVNARMEKNSCRVYRLFGIIFRPLFSYLDPVLAQTYQYATRFKASGVNGAHLRVSGNLKALQEIRPLSGDRKNALRVNMNIGEEEYLITAGCLHPGEATVVSNALQQLSHKGMQCKCLIIPRHISAASRIAKEVGPEALFCEEMSIDTQWNVCTISNMGVC